MPEPDGEAPDRAEGAVELIPDVLDIGSETEVRVVLTGERAGRLAGRTLDIVDRTGTISARLRLLPGDGGAAHGTCTLRAPKRPGRAVWTACLPGKEDGEPGFDLAFEIRPHSLSLTVWDMPLAVERGARFALRVGLRSSAGCNLSGHRIELSPEAGGAPVSAEIGDTPKTGTEALYWTEIALEAPDTDGQARWNVTARGDGLPDTHSDARARVAVNVVPPGEHRLSVSVIDAETSVPIPGAKVVAHPFRALTDTSGHAELHLPPGRRKLFVSGPDHIPYQVEGDVTEDMTITAVLDRDRPMTEAEIWT